MIDETMDRPSGARRAAALRQSKEKALAVAAAWLLVFPGSASAAGGVAGGVAGGAAGSVAGGVAGSVAGTGDCPGDPVVSPDVRTWHPMTIDFRGPVASEADVDPNPFLDHRLQVVFTGPHGGTFDVPGFFAGDGAGGGGMPGAPGDTWRVRFAPDAPGPWTWTVNHRVGSGVAVDPDPAAGAAGCLDGLAGSFVAAPRDPRAPGFLRWGRLLETGGHYLRFADGPVFIKGGADSPENVLGFDGFDNTPNARHDWLPHLQDWSPGDPDWDRTDPPGVASGRPIIGALNYLAEQGVNSIYFLPMNIGGDARDTWPYPGPIDRSGDPGNDNLRIDLSKLAQWRIVFEHAQRLGIHLHVVLNEAEAPNKLELDEAELGPERTLFYRELVARFGDLNALQWNVCEEYNLGLNLGVDRVLAFADRLAELDPYDHPIAVHNTGNPRTTWDAFVGPGGGEIGLTSLQYFNQIDDLGDEVEYFRQLSQDRGRPIPVMIDEPEGIDDVPDGADGVRRRMTWEILLSGGGVEWYIRTQDQSLEDFRPFEQVWRETAIARRFLEGLPVESMEPADGLLAGESGADGGGEVLAQLGTVYAVHLPDASPSGTLDLSAASGELEQRWFDPRAGMFVGEAMSVAGGGPLDLGPPPSAPDEDWVVLVRRPIIDCNGNLVPDEIDLERLDSLDCNGNSVPDECDIASGTSNDADGDGVPDECACPGDVDGDGVVGFGDALLVLSAWGPCTECPSDVDGDGIVGFVDLLAVLGAWGPCPA